MLQASDFGAIDIISPFLGVFVAELCGLREEASITAVFTKYVDVVNFIC